MTGIEALAAVLGLANVWLVVRRNVWNYPFGIAMVILYARVFWDAKLYSDALLQIFFLLVQIYGWRHWVRIRAETGGIRVELLGNRARIAILLVCAAAIAGWGQLMHSRTDASYPWWDAGILVLSVAAQMLLARRYLESWILWIVVDIISVGLYAAKGLWLTLGLYAVFLGLATAGLIQWARVRSGAPEPAA